MSGTGFQPVSGNSTGWKPIPRRITVSYFTSDAKTKPEIDIARAYDAPAPDGRFRVLVDRLWPRGVKKEDLKLDAWMKQLAPRAQLRRWFNHDPQPWDEFRKRFFKELEAKPDELA